MPAPRSPTLSHTTSVTSAARAPKAPKKDRSSRLTLGLTHSRERERAEKARGRDRQRPDGTYLVPHGAWILAVRHRSAVAVATRHAGLAAGGAPGAVHSGRGGGAGPVADLRCLRREGRARAGRLPPGDDGGAADLRVLHRTAVFAAHRASDARGRCVPRDRWRPTPRPRLHRDVPQAAPGCACGAVHAGVAAVPEGGAGQVGAHRDRRHQAQGERVQAQSDELRADGGGGEEAPRRSAAAAGRGGAHRCRGRWTARQGTPWRRATQRAQAPRRSASEDPRGESRARARSQGEGRGQGGRGAAEAGRARARAGRNRTQAVGTCAQSGARTRASGARGEGAAKPTTRRSPSMPRRR